MGTMSNERKVAVAELVCRALADLREPKGSTEKQIRNYIENEYKIPDVAIKKYISTALQRGVAFGLINKKRGYYQLSKLVDNIRVIAQRRNKRKPSAKVVARRVRTPAVRKVSKTRRNSRRPINTNICNDPDCKNKSGNEHEVVLRKDQSYDDAFDDNFGDDDENNDDDKEVQDNASDDEERDDDDDYDDDVQHNKAGDDENDDDNDDDDLEMEDNDDNRDDIDENDDDDDDDDEEMEADDQEEYYDDDDETNDADE